MLRLDEMADALRETVAGTAEEFPTLSNDELRVVFLHCTTDALLHATCVCKDWSALANERVLWANACDHLWPGVVAASQTADTKALYRRLARLEVAGTSERQLREEWIPRVADYFPKLQLDDATREPEVMRAIYDVVRRYAPSDLESDDIIYSPTRCSDLVLLWKCHLRGALHCRHVISLNNGQSPGTLPIPDEDPEDPVFGVVRVGLSIPIPELQSYADRKEWVSTDRSKDVMWLVHKRTGKVALLTNEINKSDVERISINGDDENHVPHQNPYDPDKPFFVNISHWPSEGTRALELILLHCEDRRDLSFITVRAGVMANEDDAELGAGTLFVDIDLEQPDYNFVDGKWDGRDYDRTLICALLETFPPGQRIVRPFETLALTNGRGHVYFSAFDLLRWR